MKTFFLKKLLASKIHGRVRGGFRLTKSLTREMSSVPIQIDGYPSLYVDLRSLDEHSVSLYLANPLPQIPHEPFFTEIFHRIVKASDTVFDVGANLGLHTLTFSKVAREVISFEPNPSLVPNLRKTVANLPNTRLLEICLSDRDGTVDFHISNWDHMLGSLANWSGQPTTTVSVPARSIDSLIEEGLIPMPQVLKVDVEGAEMMVFRGADKLFSGDDAPRTVIFEELNTASRKLGISDGAPADYLKEKGYFLYLIEDDQFTALPDVRPEAANLIAIKRSYIDLLDGFSLA
ncbi:MAG: FkbM family methyltransferase [Acidobacteria bacterium]|jgi:FkbM family methyltransferase|nr:FkbM family methyltransferase [Acidobacteriota bacterium]